MKSLIRYLQLFLITYFKKDQYIKISSSDD